ncbi:MAG: hypothetical protein IKA03_03935 [Alphaproteobacteria bacterium]|nr:hypothetical protein [Alphaproteobacteria bacterium]
MKIIYLLSKSLFPFVLGGMLGASIWGETQLLWWMVALIIIGIPYLAGQLYVYHRYRKFVNEWVCIMDDFPSKKDWKKEKESIRKESKYGFLFE